jgi:hypothetical protein
MVYAKNQTIYSDIDIPGGLMRTRRISTDNPSSSAESVFIRWEFNCQH